MAKDFNKDIQDAVSATTGKGFGDVPKTEKTQEPKPQSSAKAIAVTNKTTDTLQSQAAQSYEKLSKADELATTAEIKTALKEGQDLALTREIAKTTGYLGTTAELTVAGAKNRINGSRAVRNKSDKAAADAVVKMLGSVESEGDDFLLELSGLETSNMAQLLPSLY